MQEVLPLRFAFGGLFGMAGIDAGQGVQATLENARLKKLVADLSLDKAILQDVLSKNSQASAHETSCRLRDHASRLQ
jgi:hypothetical protein